MSLKSNIKKFRRILYDKVNKSDLMKPKLFTSDPIFKRLQMKAEYDVIKSSL